MAAQSRIEEASALETLSEFRRDVREFVAANLPETLRHKVKWSIYPGKEELTAWTRQLHAKGWATPAWPVEWGGTGWSAAQLLAFNEEMARAWAPDPLFMNVAMIGPVLIAFGTARQKAELLPRIATNELWFCQGFSEPEAGSDLASMRTRAERIGDRYVVNGQKVWTSYAAMADWMFAIVRTSQEARKQQGLSFILLDMRTPGISVRPIPTIDCSSVLNEVRFDNVEVPTENLIGAEGEGWSVAKYLLGNERVGIARAARTLQRLALARELAGDGSGGIDPVMAQRIAMLEAELRVLEMTQRRAIAEREGNDGRFDPLASIMKLKGAELQQQVARLLADIAGPRAWIAGDDDEALAGAASLNALAATIYGGSSEIQKSILAKALMRG